VGCIPTKTLVGSATAIHTTRRGAEFGFRASGLEIDWPRVRERKDKIVNSIVSGTERSLQQNPRIDFIRGWARFSGPGRLDVGDRIVEAERVIIASGVVPNIPDIPGLKEAGFFTNESVMDMESLPGSMVIFGGGPEGMEFGQIFHRLGVQMTILQRRDRVLPREDEEVSRELEAILGEEGIAILTRTVPTGVEKLAGGRVAVTATVAGKQERIEADRILVAAGRRPHHLVELGLEHAGIEGDPEKGIRVDDTLRTTAPNVWAIGDVLGRMQYTHFAVYTSGIAVRNALRGEARRYDTGRIPRGVFTDPEVASVGLTAEEARAQGRRVKVGKNPMRAVGRARAMGETKGFAKFVVDADTNEVLGMHVLAHMGADLLPQGILMMHTGSIDPLQACVCIHPTLSEGVKSAAVNLKPLDSVATAMGDLPDDGQH
jgi:pyruvate/2-oxoglutarate dehydrogenase complex dihydrolipoamide dehydrogenase (E3) component